jgi:hypothetical protein
MKTVTMFIYASVALTILSACGKTAVQSQCATPTLDPSSTPGPAGQPLRVTIETTTPGAYLSWTDNPGCPPTPTTGNIIQATKGVAPTVFGRTLRAMAFKSGWTDSSTVQGTYVGQ